MKPGLFLFSVIFHLSAGAQLSWNIDSIGRWQDPVETRPGDYSVYNEVWGFTMNGGSYGVIGSRTGTYIVNVSNPKAPQLVQFIAGKHYNATNRDYHDYKGYLYMVCDQGESSLQIADLRYLPDSVHLIYDQDTLFKNCHNIFIDTLSARLYACDVFVKKDDDRDLMVYDISNSPIPTELVIFDDSLLGSFHDIYVRRDTVYGNRGNSGLFIYDFRDPHNPTLLGSSIEYPDRGFNHAGYAAVNSPYYYFTDETRGTDVKVVDVSSIDDPEVVKLFNSGRHKPHTVAHNVLVKEDRLFISYYHEGLVVYDIKDPARPKQIGYYRTYNHLTESNSGDHVLDYTGFRGAWGVYPFLPSGNILVSDRQKGLFILASAEHRPSREIRKLYPNPLNDQARLAYPIEKIFKMDLYDLSGKLVKAYLAFEQDGPDVIFHIDETLTAGVYFLKVTASGETFTAKVVKE